MSQGFNNPDSQLAVFKILKEQLVEKEQGIDKTITYALNYSSASYPLYFFSKLKSELNVTSAILIG
jgi:hypothetical protein